MKRTLLALLFGLGLIGCGAAPTPIPTTIPTLVASSPTPNITLAPTATLPTAIVPPTPAANSTRAPSPTSAKSSIQTPAWFNDVVLYEIFPRSFYDASGDGIGDLKGITQKLDYLKDLGIGAVWLTPVFASPSYHGYDTTDYYKVNPDFGSEQDLIDLVNAAHERNIKIILDFVAGHTSDQHPFFKDAYGNPQSKYANWYRWLNDAHTSYEHFGAADDLPSLNQDNPETRQYLIDAAKYWMDKAHVDGYRLDYALGVSHDFWKAFRTALKAKQPDILLLGEVWTSGLKIVPYYDNEFDATFDFPVYFDLMGSHEHTGNSPLLGKGTPSSFETSIKAESLLYNPGAQSVRFLNNHDTLRVASQLQNEEREELAATLLFTLPSTPMIYYGEEIGMLGDKSDGDKTLREPMDWYAAETGAGMPTWYKPDSGFNKPDDGISVQEEQANDDSLIAHYRALIALREKYPTLRKGEFVPVTLKGNPLAAAFLRRSNTETLVALFNFDTQPVTISLPVAEFDAPLKGFTDLLAGDALTPPASSDMSIVVPPLHSYLLRVDP